MMGKKAETFSGDRTRRRGTRRFARPGSPGAKKAFPLSAQIATLQDGNPLRPQHEWKRLQHSVIRRHALWCTEFSRSLSEAGAHRRRPRPLFTALHFKLYGFTFLQPVEVQLLEAAAMKENFLPIRGTDESEPAITDNTFDCALHSHLNSAQERSHGGSGPNCWTARETTTRTWAPLYQEARANASRSFRKRYRT